MSRPQIIIDGRRLTRQATGVGRYLSLLLNQWAIAPEQLPFQPIVKLHRPDNSFQGAWQSVISSQTNGSRLPGLVWENLCLATSADRHQPLFAPANLVPQRWRGPVVLVVHDTFAEYPDSGLSFMQRLQFRARYRFAASRANLILTPSESTAADVQTFFAVPQSRIRVLPPGLPACFRPDYQLWSENKELKEPFVLFVGKKSRRRHFDQLIQAVGSIRRKGYPLQLVAVGPKDNIERTYDYVNDLGHVPDDDLIRLYQRAIGLICPSTREGFGLPVLEALACGCPVVTIAKGAISEIVGDCCLSLQSPDASDLETKIMSLLNSETLRQSLRDQGIERSRRFQVGRFASDVAAAIAEFCG